MVQWIRLVNQGPQVRSRFSLSDETINLVHVMVLVKVCV